MTEILNLQVQDRQKLVRHFNDNRDASNVFLLSTKAGGVGLNLIGASRLILYDSDWNPANDQQAMARIWRDGQVRPCHIYRLITTVRFGGGFETSVVLTRDSFGTSQFQNEWF